MPSPSRPFAEWDKSDLESLITDPPAVENARLEFKAECKVLSESADEKDKARRDVLVDVSALANAGGGAILIGVRQSALAGDQPKAVKIEGVEDAGRLKQAVESLVATHLDVRPGPLKYHQVHWAENRDVLIVQVPENTSSLSMVTYKELGQFWVRRGTDNRLMTTDEIQYRFAQFAKIRESAFEELSKIHARVLSSPRKEQVWFAGVPIQRARDHIPVDVRRVQGLLRNSSYFSALPDRKGVAGFFPCIFCDRLVPSVRGIRFASNSTILEIQRDGTVVFGVEPWVPTDGTCADQPGTPRAMELWTIYEPLLSGLHLFKDVQDKYTIGKVGVVQAGLIGCRGRSVTARAGGYHGYSLDRAFDDNDIQLDPILLDETWVPRDLFDQWATQIANCLGEETPLPYPPWIQAR